MNLFEEAIEKNELLKFALGQEKYFVVDRDYGEHSVISSWINCILPLQEVKGVNYVNSGIEQMIRELTFASNLESFQHADTLLYQLHTYYYLMSEGRINAISLEHLNAKMEDILNSYSDVLEKTDKAKSNAIKNTIQLIKSRGGLVNAIN
ncbi:MAG: hypothetical protein K1X55_03410 [Chitinophagales bacterium]|nr:hypothetical protein [Chitinophagales bacterium]